MILENTYKSSPRAPIFNGCAQLSVNVEATYRVGFGRDGRKITPNDARYLRGGWKTIRPATGRQSSAGLTNDGVASNGY